ncbi:unnamed protein product [Protopolystoma xenopodis]|uniref:Uncharacterized protein n=1 Tax=Protopolystoma xenopodis TaxID=117903 RepID=A0A448WND9_9PLAT|nr:unnamed protein product [Protopolystoma xenopodis]
MYTRTLPAGRGVGPGSAAGAGVGYAAAYACGAPGLGAPRARLAATLSGPPYTGSSCVAVAQATGYPAASVGVATSAASAVGRCANRQSALASSPASTTCVAPSLSASSSSFVYSSSSASSPSRPRSGPRLPRRAAIAAVDEPQTDRAADLHTHSTHHNHHNSHQCQQQQQQHHRYHAQNPSALGTTQKSASFETQSGQKLSAASSRSGIGGRSKSSA